MSSKRPDPVSLIPHVAPRVAEAGLTTVSFPGIYAGTSGWAYASWKPRFYPEKLSARKFLEHYATRLNAVEVNYTFRTLPSASMISTWLAATPSTFRFSFKAPQRMTHFSRLAGCDTQLEQLFAALEPVREAGRLGPVLFQLPPNFKADRDRLSGFLDSAALAGAQAPRVAFEFRHPSWFDDPVYEILHEHSAALCIADGDEFATPEVQCAAQFACYRLRRSGGYTHEEIAAFAERFRALSMAGREVYAFFRHEDEPMGALNAAEMLTLLAGQAVSGVEPGERA